MDRSQNLKRVCLAGLLLRNWAMHGGDVEVMQGSDVSTSQQRFHVAWLHGENLSSSATSLTSPSLSLRLWEEDKGVGSPHSHRCAALLVRALMCCAPHPSQANRWTATANWSHSALGMNLPFLSSWSPMDAPTKIPLVRAKNDIKLQMGNTQRQKHLWTWEKFSFKLCCVRNFNFLKHGIF